MFGVFFLYIYITEKNKYIGREDKMKKKISLLLLALVFLFAFEVASAEEYLVVDRDEQSTGVETTTLPDGSYDLSYNKETKTFQVVYNITSEAPGEVTLDLTNVIDLLVKCADGRIADEPNVKKAIEEEKNSAKFYVGNIEFTVDLSAMKASILSYPGDRFGFVVNIKNSSGRTYFYKEDSLTIATPKHPENDGKSIGFDGQTIPDKLTSKSIYYGYSYNLENHNFVNDLVDRAIEKYALYEQYFVNKDGVLGFTSTKITIEKDSDVILVKGNYYYKVGDYYVLVNKYSVDTNTLKTKSKISSNSGYAYDANGNKVKGITNFNRDNGSQEAIKESVSKYLNEYYNGNVDNYFLEEFNKKYGTNYTSKKELSDDDLITLLKEISTTYMKSVGIFSFNDGDSLKYDNFYNSLLSVVVTTEEEYSEKYKGEDSWSYEYDSESTVGKLMKEKMNNVQTGKYNEYDEFLSNTIGEVKNNEISSFVFGINLDGELTNNNYQDYNYGLYASLKLYAIPYVVYVNYIDVDGNVLADQVVEYNKYTGDEYKTVAKDIKDYELVRIDGEATGVIQDKDVVVTYVYEFVMGEGGEEFDVVQTGSEIDYSLMSSALVTLSLIGIAIISKKRRNN